MVEINNQRKAFLDMSWSEGPITDVRKTRNHGYDVVCRRRAIYWITPITLANLIAAKLQNSNQQTPDATSFFPVMTSTASSLPERLSPKSQDAVALQQIKERGAYLHD